VEGLAANLLAKPPRNNNFYINSKQVWRTDKEEGEGGWVK
jgi:hypothetical protein